MRKLLILSLLLLPLLFSCSRAEDSKDEGRLRITALNFPCYDAARAVVSDSADLHMLIPPGSEVHDWEPSPDDIIRILSSDLFIYVGGESDEWVRRILGDLDGSVAVFSLIEHSPVVLEEETKEGMQSDVHAHDEHGHKLEDEHVWTSLENMAAIIKDLAGVISSIDGENREYYEENASSYIESILELRDDMEDVVRNAERNLIVVADRFPLLYFADEFSLSYYAAFPGCASGTEPSARTVAFLIDKVKEENIPAVLHIELSNTLLASLIAEESGAEVYEINSAQNISRRDFERGVTYVDIMQQNLELLKEVLN